MPTDLNNSTILVTGGTGSFGHAFTRHMMSRGFKEIRILSRDELKQHDMRVGFEDARIRFYVGDIRDRESVDRAMAGVDYVFQAAALKQVPSCDFFPMEAVRTNVIGSHNVLQSAVAHGVQGVVCLSTDKAVFPINGMGMTKALMEKIAQAAAREYRNSKTVISSVRYGNVMYSRGSVIPLFVRQIEEGRPLTVTDPNMTRFLMPLRDAVDLVEYAMLNARPGDLFIRKAPASTIADLVEAVKDLFGAPNPVKYIGERHGEKLYETLASAAELMRSEDMGDYYRVRMDDRDLNYNAYYTEGAAQTRVVEDFHSHNATRLDRDRVTDLLLSLPEMQEALKRNGVNALAKRREKSASRKTAEILPVKTIGITGADGMMGQHLRCLLKTRPGVTVKLATRETFKDAAKLAQFAEGLDAVVHLAGMNRGSDGDIAGTNPALAEMLVKALETAGTHARILYANTTHSEGSSIYGQSKLKAAEILRSFADKNKLTFTNVILPHVFGEGGKPFYNSVVHTFCHQIVHGEELKVSADAQVELLHAGRAAELMLAHADAATSGNIRVEGTRMQVSELAGILRDMAALYQAQIMPSLENSLRVTLFNTYRSFLYPKHYPVALKLNTDNRGNLFEAVKGNNGGQSFLSSTLPGMVRGNHFHRYKVERFLVVQGQASIRIRPVLGGEVKEFKVSGDAPCYIDIPTLHTHNITNTGAEPLLTMFWSNEIFDPSAPDTYSEIVENGQAAGASDGQAARRDNIGNAA